MRGDAKTVERPARAVADDERLARRSSYDYVVVGGGPNGLGIAAYLSKWGFSVCVLDARPEIGGGAENVEPVPGYSIDPHASYFYGGTAPGVEQLELGRYGFRLSPVSGSFIATPDGRWLGGDAGNVFHDEAALDADLYIQRTGADPDSAKFYVEFMANLKPRIVEFLRSIYWTPPYDERWGINKLDLPETQIFKEILPLWDPSIPDMSLYELSQMMGLGDPSQCGMLIGAWGNGPHPYWKGMAIPAFAVLQLLMYTNASPVGGMHALAHALARAALAHGSRIFVNAPVSEVIVRDGRAVGVRVADDSALEEKTIHANLGVIMGTHIKQLPGLVSDGALTPDFVQRIDDLSLRGGSLFVANLVVNELPRFSLAPELNTPEDPLTSVVLNASTPNLMELMRDVHSFRTHPTDLDHYAGVWFINHGAHDPTRVRGGPYYVYDMNLQVPVPEEHRDGPDAVNRATPEIIENVKALMRQYAPNMTDDKYAAVYVNTPHDSEFRNLGFVGGNWMGMRESENEWGSRKPLPELARYRTPVEGLYLCNQTSHPGGLCLIAVPYNLMHILHEDYDEVSSTTPEWWYPSPWHITDREGGTK